MHLAQYLEKKKIKPADFAKIIGVHRSSVARFCSKTRRPKLETLQKIQEATNGAVKPSDFFAEQPHNKSPS